MYLKSIELQGFKSFPDKTKLTFDSKGEDMASGVTVIVGPNGSGKSNIADAMRWVLGEISSKTLRGTKMEDVIFGGADSRRPMGFAEVSVTFDNTDEENRLDCPYDEVTVTRRYFRAGESEYYINRRPVRLRDIYELFMNTGIGRDGYSIIGQGRIAEMVSRKSDERRGIFEDASGIAKYRHKKNEAERKLSQTEDNMTRVNDIFLEIEAQVGPLEREAGKAKRAIELMDTKKKVDVSLWLFDTEKLRTDISVAEDALRHSAFDLKNAEDSMQSLDARNAKLFDASQSGKIASSQVLSEIRDVTNRLHTLDSEFRVSESNISHAGELMQNAEQSRASFEKTLADEKIKSEAQKGKINELKASVEEWNVKLEGAEDEIFDQKCKIAQLDKDIDTAFSDSKKAEEVATDIKVRISVLENARSSGSDRNADILSDIEEYEQAQAKLEKEKSSKEKTVNDYDKAILEADAEIAEQEDKLTSANNTYGELYEEINNKKLRRDSALQRVSTIKAMEEQFEGYANSVRYVMSGYSEGKITDIRGNKCGKIYGPLSKVISVDSQFITAIEVALGANLQNIVVEDEDTAKSAMYYLKRGQAGRATFFPISSMRPSTETPEMREARGFAGYIDTADNLCRRDEKFDNVISSLLGRTLVFDSIENATVMARATKYKVKVVTLDGQQINAGGSFTGGSVKQGSGALSRAEEMKTLTSDAEKLSVEIKALESKISSLKSDIEEYTERITEVEDRKELLGVLRNTENAKLEQIIAKAEANKSLLEKMKADYDQIVEMSERYEEDIAALREEEKAQNIIISEILAAREDKHRQKVDAEDAAAELEKNKTSIIIKINEIQKDIETAEALLAVSEERIRVCNEDVSSACGRIEAYKLQIQNTTIAQAENRKSYAECEKLLAELNEKKNELDAGNMEFEKKLNEINTLIREKMSEKELIFRAHTQNESKLSNLRDTYDKLAGKLWEDYELTRNDAVALGYPEVTPENRSEYVRTQTECKNKLRAIGHVDLDAVNKYKEVKERYDYMSVQIKDLEKARAELEGIINQLESEMKVAFTESFNQINENFGKTFSELFGGGSAELTLTDPENVLESGIEIKAAPPGKIIKNLMQLSGGEQAFIGVALFFAILKVNPTPFCILDEIEAALDEVNVERLAQYIKRYSDGTQFIMITHRRGTMAAATTLYGVTMPEHGISKVLTLDVKDIEKKKENEWNGLFE
ncbi:MAG: chromosome segregation protein SMC [Ruminococcaceae bacterium]|nr:chromosome segregation protein SMC [Oscillospiraceae bacterium]